MIARTLAACTVALATMVFQAPAAQAASYPDHPIRLIVPTSPGSTADVVARVVAENMGKALSQSLIVENLSGAAGIPGTRQLVSSRPDGYTLAIVSSNHAINPALYKDMPYDSVRDITPISVIGTTPLVVVVSKDSPYQDIGALLSDAKAQPGKLNYGSSGTGSVLHLAGELLKSQGDVDMTHIPYRGGSALITDVMSGQIHTAFLAVPSVLPQIRAGALRALAVSTPERLEVLPEVPTLAESGVKDYAYDAWIALIGPAGMSAEHVKQLQAATAQVMKEPAVLKALQPLGFVSQGSTTEYAQKILVDEIRKTQGLVSAAGIEVK